MKTETIADIIQLSALINDSQLSYYSKAERVKRVCRLAKTWSNLQVKATGQILTERDKKTEARIEKELPKLCYPNPVRFEALHARMIINHMQTTAEFYFPDLAE